MRKINDGMEWCEVFVLLWSKAASKSKWVEKEWECALALEKIIVPCRLDDTPLPPILRPLSYCDFREFEKGYKRLFDSLGLAPIKELKHYVLSVDNARHEMKVSNVELIKDKVLVSENGRVKIEDSGAELTLGINPQRGTTGDLTSSIISIKGNVGKLNSFGFDLIFNPSMLDFLNVTRGTLTKDWLTFNVMEIKEGEVRVGLARDKGKLGDAEGSIASINFMVVCKDCDDGMRARIRILNLVGDLAGMKVVPSEVEFTYEETEERKNWKRERDILLNLKQPLREFNQMNRFPDFYKAPKCLELATHIEKEAERIKRPEFEEIKKRLLEYAGRKEQIDQNTPLKTLMNLFQKRVEPAKFEPFVLCEEIDKAVSL